jgi:predicted O-linked N-acetylglucosamine transferase (SPINDLY family)
MAGVFEHHDRSRFEVIAISLLAEEDTEFGRRVKAGFDRFEVVTGYTDTQVGALMRELQVDVAVDLMGHTDGQRTGIFAHRAAPVQVNMLGYPGTMGASCIDYIIADDFVIPHERQVDYAEHVAYLPHCFQPNDDRRPVVAQGLDRATVGLPDGGFVWCCMNNGYKVTGAVFEVWMHLLRETPGSVLWMLAESPVAQGNLRREAQRQGVARERLVFADRVSYEDHLARFQVADLFLDTTPFNGGATASDALWAGLPVLTCTDEAFASRMAGSLLRAVGLRELVADDLGQYQERALELARSPAQLAALRRRLAQARTDSPLFDTARYCRNLEAAFTTMVDRSRRGLLPEAFAVAEGGQSSL